MFTIIKNLNIAVEIKDKKILIYDTIEGYKNGELQGDMFTPKVIQDTKRTLLETTKKRAKAIALVLNINSVKIYGVKIV